MSAVPADEPVMQPVELTTETWPLAELHAPPDEPSVRQTVSPTHTGTLAVMIAGSGLTVNVIVDVVVPHELVTL